MPPYRELADRFILAEPASSSAIAAEENAYGGRLPEEYVRLARISNGLYTRGNLSILGVEGIVQRNTDYDVQQCMPGFFMIGDDGCGIAILLNLTDRRIYEVDMGIMDVAAMRLSADSLEDLLRLGTSLAERGGW